jgi:hypothetical protein
MAVGAGCIAAEQNSPSYPVSAYVSIDSAIKKGLFSLAVNHLSMIALFPNLDDNVYA